jgi:hypothetical protein
MFQPEKKDIKYIYIGERSYARTNVITIAFAIMNNILYFGVAFSNKADLYNKDIGKQLAFDRMFDLQYTQNVKNVNTHYKVISNVILKTLLNTKNYPKWAQSYIIRDIMCTNLDINHNDGYKHIQEQA